MLQVIEQTPSRLVLRDRRRIAGAVAGVFTALCVGSVLLLALQGIETLLIPRDLIGWRLFGFGVFISLGVAFALLGVMAYQQFMQGSTLVLDRDSETMRLQTVHIFRLREITRPIYGVAGIDVQADERMRVYVLFLVLRTGERLPIATIASIDEDHMRHIVAVVRGFLRAL